MKATFFQKPLSIELVLDGESWHQGNEVNGVLTISNMGNTDLDISQMGCHLCYGINKKIKTKDSKAFTLYESIQIAPKKLAAGQTHETKLLFKLPKNSPISESTGSPYILCGNIEDPFNAGIIEIKVLPNKNILNIIEIIESFLKFKLKALKNKSDSIQAVVIPPDTKDWSSIQKMTIKIMSSDSDLIFDFDFLIKKIDFSSSSTKTKDEKKNIKLTLKKEDYLVYGDSPNQDTILNKFNEVLDQVKLKRIF